MKRENAAKRYYKKNMIVFIAVFVPLDLLFWLITLPFLNSTVNRSDLFIYPIVLALVGIPFIIYYVVKFIHYSNVNFINIKKGKVVNSESYNDKHRVTTKHCHRRADGYFGVTVTIGQDPSTGEWIILE